MFVPFPSIGRLTTKQQWNNVHEWFIEEKIDGSQLTMDVNSDNTLSFYNKNKLVYELGNPFAKAVAMLRYKFDNKNILDNNLTYHGESVCRRNHNVTVYDRTPENYYIVYDIYDKTRQCYLSPHDRKIECERIGLEIVPILYYNEDPSCLPVNKSNELLHLIKTGELISCLGGTPEGVIIKHNNVKTKKGNIISLKFKMVTDVFKEYHTMNQKGENETADEFLERYGTSFCTEARFRKAYQHLCENGKIANEMLKREIINELNNDFDKEYKESTMLILWLEFEKMIKKHANKEIDEWMLTIKK